MNYPLRFMHLILLAALGMVFTCTLGAAAESDDEILIGRIAHIEGKLLRYIEEDKDWVNTVKDSPFGLDDTLYSGDDAKAEMIMPNKTWLRVGENTQIQLIHLNFDATTVDVAAGLARLYNKGEDAVIKVTTPFGYVVAPAGTVFDLYVGDESLEVIAIRGNVDFVHENSKTKYEVSEGSSSLIADGKETAQGNGMVDSAWDDWNDKREVLWTKRLRNQSASMDLLPEPIRDQSYILEENGQWERVHYEGAYRDMWRPTRIDPGWRPFTAGRWTVYYGDNCWIPDESFGYVTHHYGSWVYVESYHNWYWMPPVARFVDSAPGISMSFAWFPGRVGWLHRGSSIGWVPLAPDEEYYGYRHWGRRTVVISNTTVVNINIGRYRYIDEAVIIDRDYFYRGRRYTPHIQQNIGRDVIINNYRPTTVINNTIINNINIDKRRYTYNDAEVSRKPHTTVINRINDNHKAKQDFGPGNRERIQKELTHIQAKAEPSPRVEIHKPQLSSRLVGNDDIAKPFNALQQERKLIKPKERERLISKEKDQRLDPKGKGESGQTRRRNDQEDKGRSVNTEDGPKQMLGENQPKTSLQDRERRRRPDDQTRQDESGDTNNRNKDLQQRLKSPREKQTQGQESLSPPLSKRQGQEEERQRQENGLKKPQEQLPLSPKLEQGKQQEQLQQQQQIPAPRGDKERRQRNLGETGEARDLNTLEDKPRLKSPRELSNKEDNRAGRKDDKLRQQENTEVVNQQKLQQQEANKQLQEQELKQQQKEVQGRQQQEIQQRQQQEEQGRQQQEIQQRQQKKEQGRQQQEIQQRQQKEEQGRKQQEMQQRQQKEEQGRKQQEMQQRQQKEEQGRQQQEMQQRQQKEEQRRQQQEMQQRQQKEEQGRQQQEMQQRQQKDEQRRQQQEMQQRQQKEEQGRQQQEMQQRQKQDQQRQQVESAKQKEQAVKQKTKKQLEEEQQQREKQQAAGAGG